MRKIGIEQVTTQAGTFRAFKLESDDRAGPRDYFTTTYWYSPETRSIVKSVFDGSAGGQQTGLQRSIELIKVTPVTEKTSTQTCSKSSEGATGDQSGIRRRVKLSPDALLN